MQKIYIDFDGVIMDTVTVIQSLAESIGLDYKNYDAIIGYRADDSYFSFAQDFINGTI